MTLTYSVTVNGHHVGGRFYSLDAAKRYAAARMQDAKQLGTKAVVTVWMHGKTVQAL